MYCSLVFAGEKKKGQEIKYIYIGKGGKLRERINQHFQPSRRGDQEINEHLQEILHDGKDTNFPILCLRPRVHLQPMLYSMIFLVQNIWEIIIFEHFKINYKY